MNAHIIGQRDAAHTALRLQTATSIIGHLLPLHLDAAARRARQAQGLVDGTPVSFDADAAVDAAANLALAAADKLLVKCGLVEEQG